MRRRSAQLLALLALLPGMLGDTCTGDPPTATVFFDLAPSAQLPLGQPTPVVIMADLQGVPLQAFDVGVRAVATGSAARVGFANVAPHVEYDDDGTLFVDPVYDALGMKLERIVDLTHGPAAPRNLVRLAAFDVVGFVPGAMRLELRDVKLVDDGGHTFAVTVADANVSIVP